LPKPNERPETKNRPNPITFQIEQFSEIVLEFKGHANEHWREFGMRQELRNFAFNYQMYLAADRAGRVLTATARRNRVPIGYLLFHVIADPHAMNTKIADSIFYYTIPHPMRGLLLRGMIRCGVRELLSRGIKFIRFRHRVKRDASAILKSLGFELEELCYSLDPEKFRG
jgi:hypothetical protein